MAVRQRGKGWCPRGWARACWAFWGKFCGSLLGLLLSTHRDRAWGVRTASRRQEDAWGLDLCRPQCLLALEQLGLSLSVPPSASPQGLINEKNAIHIEEVCLGQLDVEYHIHKTDGKRKWGVLDSPGCRGVLVALKLPKTPNQGHARAGATASTHNQSPSRAQGAPKVLGGTEQ